MWREALKLRPRECLRPDDPEHEVAEELLFHIDLRTADNVAAGMASEEAREDAVRRFGDLELIQARCAEISKRNKPAMKLLKLFLLLPFTAGLWLRVRGVDVNVTHLGSVLMATAALGQLLLHLRGLRTTGSLPVNTSRSLSLIGLSEPSSIEAYDELGRTPVERLVAGVAPKGS